MTGDVLVDTGPVVALFAEKDGRHAEAIRGFDQFRPPLVTCWPVLTEAAWLLRHDARGVDRLFDACEGGLLHLEAMLPSDIEPVQRLMSRYGDLRLQLADACLLTLAERLGLQQVFTFDRRDFSVALTPAGRPLRIVPES